MYLVSLSLGSDVLRLQCCSGVTIGLGKTQRRVCAIAPSHVHPVMAQWSQSGSRITGTFYTSVKIIKNEIRCRDDTVPKTVDTRSHCKVWLRACNNLPQPPKKRDVGRGLRKIVACSQPYLAVASCIYSFWHGVIPTSYF